MVACDSLLRLSAFPHTEPWFAHEATHRFDDPNGRAGRQTGDLYGVLYAASRPDTAFAESVIHDDRFYDPRLGVHSVPGTRLRQRHFVVFRRQHTDVPLRLADLTGAQLKALGLNADLTTGGDYRTCQLWSRRIHEDARGFDGIAYPSRQMPGTVCYALFDRCELVRADSRPLSTAELTDLCDLFNVVEQHDTPRSIAPAHRAQRRPRRRG